MRVKACFLPQGKEKVEGVGTGALAAAMAYSSFDVTQLATWQAGDPVPFSFLAKTFDSIATTTKRLEIIKMLVGAFRAILATTPEDLLPIVYLCTNQVGLEQDGAACAQAPCTLCDQAPLCCPGA